MFEPNPIRRPSLTVVPYCSFWVDGIPKATPRIKAFVRGRHAGVYTPSTANDWKALVAMASKPYLPQTPIVGPVVCEITLVFPRPKRLCRKRDFAGMIPMDRKPDRDNCEKAILDMLTGVGMFRDDSQIFSGPVQKFYHAIDGKPGAYIAIGTVDLNELNRQEQQNV